MTLFQSLWTAPTIVTPPAAAETSALLHRLSPACRRSRFGAPLCDGALDAYCAEMLDDAAGLAAGLVIAGALRGVAEARPEADDALELAVVVEAGWRGRGLGARLLRTLAARAAGRGARRCRLYCDPDNLAMRRLARRLAEPIGAVDGRLAYEIAL